MTRVALICSAIAIILCCGHANAQTVLEKATRDDIFRVPADDPDMAAAMQSLWMRHVWPPLQRRQSGPPQSMSDSFPFCRLSAQVAGTQTCATHELFAQSS